MGSLCEGENRDGYQAKVMKTGNFEIKDVINCDVARYEKEYMPVSCADAKLLRGMRSNLKRTFEIQHADRTENSRQFVGRERWSGAAQRTRSEERRVGKECRL